MKKLYFAILCGLLCGNISYAAPRFAAKKQAQSVRLAPKTPSAPLWRPATQTEYMYMDGEWMELGTVSFTYDGRGNAILELVEGEDGSSKTEKTYDDYNQVLTSLQTHSEDGSEWENESKTTYQYDPVLHSYYTERMGYDWTNGAWVENFRCETNEVTRNAGGNITTIIKSLPLGDTMLPGYKLVWAYDNNATEATSMTYYTCPSGDGTTWEVYNDLEYRNIKWAATDGQMTEADMLSYVDGDNRLASCEVYYDNELDGHIIATYDDNGGYTLQETYPDPSQVGVSTVKTITDSNGSYTVTITEYFDEDGNYKPKPQSIIKIVSEFNDHGDVVKDELYEVASDGYEELAEGYAYEYTYDSNGNTTEVVTKIYDYDEDQYFPENKITYGEYSLISGLENVITDGDTHKEYYDLQGRRVENPTTGLYIIVKGGKALKIKF